MPVQITGPADAQTIAKSPPIDLNSVANSLSYMADQASAQGINISPLIRLITNQIQNYTNSWQYYQQRAAQLAPPGTGAKNDFMAQQALNFTNSALGNIQNMVTQVLPYFISNTQFLAQLAEKAREFNIKTDVQKQEYQQQLAQNQQQIDLQRAGLQNQIFQRVQQGLDAFSRPFTSNFQKFADNGGLPGSNQPPQASPNPGTVTTGSFGMNPAQQQSLLRKFLNNLPAGAVPVQQNGQYVGGPSGTPGSILIQNPDGSTQEYQPNPDYGDPFSPNSSGPSFIPVGPPVGIGNQPLQPYSEVTGNQPASSAVPVNDNGQPINFPNLNSLFQSNPYGDQTQQQNQPGTQNNTNQSPNQSFYGQNSDQNNSNNSIANSFADWNKQFNQNAQGTTAEYANAQAAYKSDPSAANQANLAYYQNQMNPYGGADVPQPQQPAPAQGNGFFAQQQNQNFQSNPAVNYNYTPPANPQTSSAMWSDQGKIGA